MKIKHNFIFGKFSGGGRVIAFGFARRLGLHGQGVGKKAAKGDDHQQQTNYRAKAFVPHDFLSSKQKILSFYMRHSVQAAVISPKIAGLLMGNMCYSPNIRVTMYKITL